MANTLEVKAFRDIPLNDPFFNSLKQDYREFPNWFDSKASEPAYVQYTDTKLTGFMYLKLEDGEIKDVNPPLPPSKRIKIGTLKVIPHGTRLGERLIKKAIDHAIVKQAEEIYVTVFPRHKPLISMLEELGFRSAGTKETVNGSETVLLKDFDQSKLSGNIRKDYPLMNTRQTSFYLLAIKPQWHSKLFPDSLLETESYDLLSDISHTNSISKTYICSMEGVEAIRAKDLLVIYRTTDRPDQAEYRSVATSICVVEEMRTKSTFTDLKEYLDYTKPFSVLSDSELRRWWNRSSLFVIKMLYNAAFTQRAIRKTLTEDVGLDRDVYWGVLPLSQKQCLKIMNLGGVDGRLIVH